jgi:hypothetical protein
MFLNHYPNYYTNSFYQGPGAYGRVGGFNGRESVVTINRSSFPFNYNYYNQINSNKIIASTHAISRGQFQKPSTPTPLKLNPNDLLLQIQTSKLPPKTRPRSRAKVTNSTVSINAKSNQSRTPIDKSTSTTSLKKNKANINQIDKSTQTNINIKLIGLKREQKPPIPPTIISNSVKREEIKKKFLKKYSSSASSPISRPLSITSEFSTVSTNSTTASTNITKLKFLGVTRCDPILYRNQYESSLISSKNIPEYLSQIINSKAINANNSLRSPYFKMLDANGKVFL